MTEETLLAEINTLIESENGKAIGLTDRIVTSTIDSFGFTMLLVSIDHKYNIYPKEEFNKINFAELTPKDIVERILKIHGNK